MSFIISWNWQFRVFWLDEDIEDWDLRRAKGGMEGGCKVNQIFNVTDIALVWVGFGARISKPPWRFCHGKRFPTIWDSAAGRSEISKKMGGMHLQPTIWFLRWYVFIQGRKGKNKGADWLSLIAKVEWEWDLLKFSPARSYISFVKRITFQSTRPALRDCRRVGRSAHGFCI